MRLSLLGLFLFATGLHASVLPDVGGTTPSNAGRSLLASDSLDSRSNKGWYPEDGVYCRTNVVREINFSGKCKDLAPHICDEAVDLLDDNKTYRSIHGTPKEETGVCKKGPGKNQSCGAFLVGSADKGEKPCEATGKQMKDAARVIRDPKYDCKTCGFKEMPQGTAGTCGFKLDFVTGC